MKKTLISLAVASAITTSLFADAETDALKAQLKAMTERLDAMETKQESLVEETANLQTGFNFNVLDNDFSHNGMGVAASKVYNSKSPLSIGGYGEMYYANKRNAGDDNIADVYRFVPYIGYRFTDNIILNTEIEFEHGGAKPGSTDAANGGDYGYAVIEFMYLDFLLNDAFNIQAGLVLAPMGLINLRHEPTLFNTVQRPLTEKYLLPSTWSTNGVIAYGNIGDNFTYNAGIMQALNFDNASAGGQSQIRSSRMGGGKSNYNNLAGVARLDYIGTPGLLVGASGYYGSASQGSVSGATALMYDVHVTYENSGFKMKALYTATKISDADKIAAGLVAGGTSIDKANGYYVNAEYDVLNMINSEYKLPVFVQYDYINPTDSVVDITNASVGVDVNAEIATTTVGVNFFPHPQVVLKADYAMAKYQNSGTTKKDQDILSVSLGFIF
ncbi:MAG: porin [Arcobacter sp.]|nr:MAG: porin [Arcobacter sp.]